MKALIWALFAVLLLGWTGLAWVSAELASWLVTAAGTAPAGAAAEAIGNWPVPPWLAVWVSPEFIQGLQATWLGITAWLGTAMPGAESLAGVITVLVWVGWGLGALALLVLAGLAHWATGLAGKARRRALP